MSLNRHDTVLFRSFSYSLILQLASSALLFRAAAKVPTGADHLPSQVQGEIRELCLAPTSQGVATPLQTVTPLVLSLVEALQVALRHVGGKLSLEAKGIRPATMTSAPIGHRRSERSVKHVTCAG